MGIVSGFVAIMVMALQISPVLAAPLNKYMDDSPTSLIQQQPAPDDIRRRLNDKMQRSIQILNNMKAEEKSQWIREYEKRLEQAIEAGDYLKAAYYRGILEQVER
ncbi:UvrB/uvrC motif-containing protein [Nitrosomonas marina]|uniref:UvrB/uvrC motif-containing protein n=1 Tax=Nitrosomonas marina TaxID=917 RepID=A0A1H9ZRJ5_9PROT|nr:UvrB/UvrC motif-containing protein [Nitrosomonas marina]SES84246.1 UvrB/uvrC motif-containing protein [Nitrosomonas marina]